MTTVDLLVNHGIPVGWTDALPWLNLTNQQPHGFHTHTRVPGEELDSADSYTGQDDAPVVTNATVVPECRHIHKSNLPADEQPNAEHALILAGEWVYKVFSSAGAFSHDICAWVRAPSDGMLDIGVPVQVHYNPKPGGDGSPGAAVWRLWIDDEPDWWHTFGTGFEDRKWRWGNYFGMRVTAGQVVTLRLQLESRSQAGIDFFTDLEAWEALFAPDNPEDPEAPTPSELPTVDYVVVVNLLPQDATQAEKEYILNLVHESRETILQSADDAARLVVPGLRGSRIKVWGAHRWLGDVSIEDWLSEKGVDTVQLWALPGAVPPPHDPEPDPEPEPDPPGPEPQYALPSANLVGLHMMNPKIGWVEYVTWARPTIHKTVNQLGMLFEAKAAFPEILTVYRRFTPDDGKWVYYPGGPRAGALAWLDGYSRDFEAHAQSEGITVEQVLQRVDVIEEVNEMIGTHDPDLGPSVEFNIAFADAVRARYGYQVSAGMLTIPVGNPGEDELLGLLPAARKAYEGGHYIGYHPYWSANRNQTWLSDHWRELAGRWTVWDDVFRQHGVYPRYYGGEMGAVYADPDWWNMNSGRGWKSCGTFTSYIAQLELWNRLSLAWNAQHGNRFIGGTIFCYTTSGQWSDFDFEPGDLAELAQAMS